MASGDVSNAFVKAALNPDDPEDRVFIRLPKEFAPNDNGIRRLLK